MISPNRGNRTGFRVQVPLGHCRKTHTARARPLPGRAVSLGAQGHGGIGGRSFRPDIKRGKLVVGIWVDAPVDRDGVDGPDSQPAGYHGWRGRLACGVARGRRWPRLRAPGRDGAARAFLACVAGCRELVEDLAEVVVETSYRSMISRMDGRSAPAG